MANSASHEKLCRPLHSLEELLSYRKHCCSFESVKQQKCDDRFEKPLPDRPRVLLCHDFMGGYLEDRFYCSQRLVEERKASGAYNPRKDYDFNHWDRIDIFCYFSHNFITVPPCKWIQQSHANGVKILGTIIIEWKPKVLQDLLESPKRAELIQCLTELCVVGNFDGWLFNMEVSVGSKYIESLRELIRSLNKSLTERAPGSLVLWYDSLTTSGRINYQNALTKHNKPFFDDCDGIFLNYGWMEEDLTGSKSLAGERAFDVYVGLDTFARGTSHAGGFNTTREAKAVTDKGLSVAIFAPGWVLECNTLEKFTENQEKFWSVLPVLRPSKPASQNTTLQADEEKPML